MSNYMEQTGVVPPSSPAACPSAALPVPIPGSGNPLAGPGDGPSQRRVAAFRAHGGPRIPCAACRGLLRYDDAVPAQLEPGVVGMVHSDRAMCDPGAVARVRAQEPAWQPDDREDWR